MEERSNDWLVCSDMHLGLHEMDNPLAQRAMRNTIDLLERNNQANLVLNGDTFDVWHYLLDRFHTKDMQSARRQFGPMGDYLKGSTGSTIFVTGNTDAITSRKEWRMLLDAMDISDAEDFRMQVKRVFYEPDRKLLMTHGDGLHQITNLIRTRGREILTELSIDPVRLPEEPKKAPTAIQAMHDNIVSLVSILMKRNASVRKQLLDIHVRLVSAFAQEWEENEQGEVQTVVFSHTHQPDIRTVTGRSIVNTGTAGPQDHASRATAALLRLGDNALVGARAMGRPRRRGRACRRAR